MIPSETLLVIPTYRDSSRLAEFLPELCAELARGPGGVMVQVVDDGSSTGEQMWLTNEIDRLRRQHLFLQPLQIISRNQGKGHAIRAGWSNARQAGWLAFVDADGAVPAVEVSALLGRARASSSPALFIAVRTDLPGKTVIRFWHRRLGSWLFNRWVRVCLKLDLPDTQCGLKIIPADFFTGVMMQSGGPVSRRAAVRRETDPPPGQGRLWHEEGFAFDLELLLRARASGLPIVTQPISWSERSGSSFGPGAMLGLFAAVWRLRRGEST